MRRHLRIVQFNVIPSRRGQATAARGSGAQLRGLPVAAVDVFRPFGLVR